MKTCGITGGIGAGKTIITRIFQVLGAPVYDADSRARRLMNNDPEITQEVSRLFGEESYKEGLLDRAFIAAIVFKEASMLEQLNRIVHPRVARDFELWSREQRSPYLLKEAALIFETNGQQGMDMVIVVTAPEELRIERVMKRDLQRSKEEVLGIINKQMSESEKVSLADRVILNDDAHLVIPQVLAIHNELIQS